MKIVVHRFLTSSPEDMTGLETAVRKGKIDPARIACVIGKTEGDGGITDPTRNQAIRAFVRFLVKQCGWSEAETHERVVLSFSGGCEGVVTPHHTIFVREEGKSIPGKKRLGLAIGHTREFRPEEIGRRPQIEETAEVVHRLIEKAQLEEVHLVQAKGAIPPGGGERCNMAYSRGATALGIALGAGEIKRSQLGPDPVCRQWNLYSGVASCSAKPDLKRTELVVMGNSSTWGGDLAIYHGVLKDILDVKGLQNILRKVRGPIAALFAKAEADPSGFVRGRRHTMLTDPVEDIRWSRCVLGAVIAGVTNDTAIYVSTRAEHHGPPGGGPVAIIVREKR